MSLPGISGFGKHFLANTNTVLTRSPTGSSILAGQPITFTATVTGPGSTPTGSVTFIDNGVGFASSSLNASGVATTTTSSLAIGGHTITAQYNGDVVFSTSVSAGVAVTIFTTTRKVLFLTSGGSWQVPSDWSNTNNSIECIGGGGGGSGSGFHTFGGGGGGGGGYAKGANVQLSPGSVLGLTIGAGGGAGAIGNNGSAGGATSLAGVTAGGGDFGTAAGFTVQGSGGSGGGGTFAGGSGGAGPGTGGGGGGAGGPNSGGFGGAAGGSGGAGDGGNGGGGGSVGGGNGGNGNEYGSGVGAGGGGGGSQGNGGGGGTYGGGGGGGGTGATSGGAGFQGVVIVTYVS